VAIPESNQKVKYHDINHQPTNLTNLLLLS